MNLDNLASKIASLHSAIKFKPTIELAAQIGELLAQVKDVLPKGTWLTWLKSHCPCISERTAQVYLQIFRSPSNPQSSAYTSIDGFLRYLQTIKRSAKDAHLREQRDELGGDLDPSYTVHHADCRTFRWKKVDVIATDPPWHEMDCYTWLGKFASKHLSIGGIIMVQTGIRFVPDVLDILRQKLSYLWMFSIVYDGPISAASQFQICWRPVLLFSKGKWNQKHLLTVEDRQQVSRIAHHRKNSWQQPLTPWHYWIDRLSRPGDTVADPFAGTGTIGLATKLAGKRKFVGTEIDPEKARIANKRITNE